MVMLGILSVYTWTAEIVENPEFKAGKTLPNMLTNICNQAVSNPVLWQTTLQPSQILYSVRGGTISYYMQTL